jgi:secreted trypsin-like serine protease
MPERDQETLNEQPGDDPAVLAAIEKANQEAGRSDKEFVRALLRNVQQDAGGGMRTRAGRRAMIPLVPVATAVKSFRIFEDPRYLANARALAERAPSRQRVVGGARVPVGQFLDCVAVGNDSQWGCTGTLIAPKVVLTAGHCADFATRIFVGSDVTQSGKVVKVKRRVRHPKYHQGKHNDLMVLILEQAVEGIEPRRIARKAAIEGATDGRVVGFGNTEATGNFGYGQKRFVDVPIASPDCKGQIGGEDDTVTYGCDAGLELVAGRPLRARDSCTGDSGGPFYLQVGEQWFIAAATSRATDSSVSNCGDGGVYVRVDRYKTWIDAIPGVTLPK